MNQLDCQSALRSAAPRTGQLIVSGFVPFLAVILGLDLSAAGADLPAQYFPILTAGLARVEERWNAEPGAGLVALEARSGWKHFPSAVLVAAVLYAKEHPANSRHGDTKILALAGRIGELLATEHDSVECRGPWRVDSTSRLDAENAPRRAADLAGLPVQPVSQRTGD